MISAGEAGTWRSCAAAPPESATAKIKPARLASGCRIRLMFSQSSANGRDITAPRRQLKAGTGGEARDRPLDESYARPFRWPPDAGEETMHEVTPAKTRQAVAAAVIGNVLEWYDFAVYAFVAIHISRKFFPAGD